MQRDWDAPDALHCPREKQIAKVLVSLRRFELSNARGEERSDGRVRTLVSSLELMQPTRLWYSRFFRDLRQCLHLLLSARIVSGE